MRDSVLRSFFVFLCLIFCAQQANAQSALVNGANQTGTIFTNTIADSYTFKANIGDSINMRLGTTGFFGQLELYSPTGGLLAMGVTNLQEYDVAISYAATNSGIFSVLVSSLLPRGSGTYVLHSAQIPQSFVVPAGDEGGNITNNGNYTGTITLGDLDIYSFIAYTSNIVNLALHATNIFGQIRLYGPSGALLVTGPSAQHTIQISYPATNSGTFTVLVSSGSIGAAGAYGLSVSGIPSDLKFSSSILSGSDLVLNGVGGVSNVVYVLYSTTNLSNPFGFWTPVLTNRFGRSGVFICTNQFNITNEQKYFRLVVP